MVKIDDNVQATDWFALVAANKDDETATELPAIILNNAIPLPRSESATWTQKFLHPKLKDREIVDISEKFVTDWDSKPPDAEKAKAAYEALKSVAQTLTLKYDLRFKGGILRFLSRVGNLFHGSHRAQSNLKRVDGLMTKLEPLLPPSTSTSRSQTVYTSAAPTSPAAVSSAPASSAEPSKQELVQNAQQGVDEAAEREQRQRMSTVISEEVGGVVVTFQADDPNQPATLPPRTSTNTASAPPITTSSPTSPRKSSDKPEQDDSLRTRTQTLIKAPPPKTEVPSEEPQPGILESLGNAAGNGLAVVGGGITSGVSYLWSLTSWGAKPAEPTPVTPTATTAKSEERTATKQRTSPQPIAPTVTKAAPLPDTAASSAANNPYRYNGKLEELPPGKQEKPKQESAPTPQPSPQLKEAPPAPAPRKPSAVAAPGKLQTVPTSQAPSVSASPLAAIAKSGPEKITATDSKAERLQQMLQVFRDEIGPDIADFIKEVFKNADVASFFLESAVPNGPHTYTITLNSAMTGKGTDMGLT